MEQQSPLSDNYISCTEPINPYHGDYVVIQLSRPYTLQLPIGVTNLWQMQPSHWRTLPPMWSDTSRNFIMPTHCVRTWSNGSFWFAPNHYFLTTSLSIVPLPRSQQYVEPQLGGMMYMYAYLLGMTNLGGLPYRYSMYGSDYSSGDSYFTNGIEFSRPYWAFPPQKDFYLNQQISASSLTAMKYIAGLNLTLFVVDISQNVINTTPCSLRTKMTVILKPLVPFVDLSGCWLQPPANYHEYDDYDQLDWDGIYPVQTTNGTPYSNGSPGEQLSILPAIALDVGECVQQFEVVLPVQLYTLASINSTFSFTLQDISNGTPAYGPNMEVVATTLQGFFWDEEGKPTDAAHASSIHFQLKDSQSLFHLSHTFEECKGRQNRPVFCSEIDAVPINGPEGMSASLLFSPKCGPGMWTNLPQNNFNF